MRLLAFRNNPVQRGKRLNFLANDTGSLKPKRFSLVEVWEGIDHEADTIKYKGQSTKWRTSGTVGVLSCIPALHGTVWWGLAIYSTYFKAALDITVVSIDGASCMCVASLGESGIIICYWLLPVLFRSVGIHVWLPFKWAEWTCSWLAQRRCWQR